MPPERLDRLGHIRQALDTIERFIDGKKRETFLSDEQLVLSIVRLLEIIGEAAKSLPEETTARYPNVPWRELARLRDKLIHGYFEVDNEIVWKIVSDDLPEIRRQLSAGQ